MRLILWSGAYVSNTENTNRMMKNITTVAPAARTSHFGRGREDKL